MAEGVRIQKALADAGVASRRAAEGLVVAGRVTVNGLPALPGQRVDPARDVIQLDGRALAAPQRHVYLALCKPAGVTSTVADRHAERTVISLVPADLARGARIYPVGRLDRDSEGLLLLTNDGGWAQRLLHPRYGVEREYAIGLGGPLDADQAAALVRGVMLEEGLARLTALRPASRVEAARLEALAPPGPDRQASGPLTWYHVVLRQGWKRQLRRMFAAVDARVTRLVRVRIGSLRLGDLRPGDLRPLTAAERDRLASGISGASGTSGAPGTSATSGTSGAPGTSGTSGTSGAPGTSATSGTAHAEGRGGRTERRRSGLVVSIDGPGSSGKSSVGASAAGRLGFRFLDTGVLYRALAWLCVERGVDPDDDATLLSLIPALELVPDDAGALRRVHVDGHDVTGELHAPDVDRLVSRVAARPALRSALLDLQRRVAAGGRIIVAGRDIGTVVLPDADLKFYLDVSLEERARRRAADRGVSERAEEAAAILEDLRRRDALDSNRETAPLRVPDDAVVVHSDGRSFEETVATVVDIIRRRGT